MAITDIEERITLDNQLDPHRLEQDLDELRQGLIAVPRRIPSKYFYDERGSALFETITRLPEYYPTRIEKALLKASAAEITDLVGAEELVELGSGAATKTRVLLDAMQRSGRLRLYVPLDVDPTAIASVTKEIAADYPEIQVHGIVADFVHHLSAIPPGEPRLVILLGSTIGNFDRSQSVFLLRSISARMAAGDFFLLGLDLVKNVEILEAAYNDSQGVTAEFNKNILRVVNRAVDADFDPDSYLHSATYNRSLDRIEMYLIASADQRVVVNDLGLKIKIRRHEQLCTEISCKYDRRRAEAMLDASGFELARWFSDDADMFALALARKR